MHPSDAMITHQTPSGDVTDNDNLNVIQRSGSCQLSDPGNVPRTRKKQELSVFKHGGLYWCYNTDLHDKSDGEIISMQTERDLARDWPADQQYLAPTQ